MKQQFLGGFFRTKVDDMVLSQTEGSVQNYGYCADLDSCKKELHNPDKKGGKSSSLVEKTSSGY